MEQDPTIIIQIQRMGDLIISFSLVERLLCVEPERPIWIVAEPCFYEPLCALGPKVVFFSPKMAPQLKTKIYKRVINVSHREEAVKLAGSLEAEEYFGAIQNNTSLYIKGAWRLYRYSIVENNRHNMFHWSDLEALGVIPEQILRQRVFPGPRPIGLSGKIGLFVGASEYTKCPDARFWGILAQYLVKQGLYPVFLGGPDDIELANEAVNIACLGKEKNFAGRFSLFELATFLQTLDLLVTPDTGPMHLANWVKTPIIDLSMGNVNPWETAALSPGQIVIAPSISCIGCWHCDGRRFICREAFTPEKIAKLILSIIERKDLKQSAYKGLTVYKTDRDERGLFFLNTLLEEKCVTQRFILGSFWKEWFISMLGGTVDRFPRALEALFQTSPILGLRIKKELTYVNKVLLEFVKGMPIEKTQDYWRHVLPVVRPFTGYIDLFLQNSDYQREALEQALYMSCSLVEKMQ